MFKGSRAVACCAEDRDGKGNLGVPLAADYRPEGGAPNKERQPKAVFLYLVAEDGFEPSKRNATDLQSAPFDHSGTPPYAIVTS